MANFCPSCGMRLPPNTKFCPGCGIKILDSTEKPENINDIKKTELEKPKSTPPLPPPSGAYTDIFANTTLDYVKQSTQNVFNQNGFEIKWFNQYQGKATKGSVGANFFAGSLAQYYEIDFQIFTLPNKNAGIRVIKSNTGLLGGVIGAVRVENRYQEIIEMLANYFKSQGIYKGRNPPK